MNNSSVIITGATGGIGEEISKLCISSNEIHNCILFYKDEAKYQSVFGEIQSCKIDKYLYDMKNDYSKSMFAFSNGIEDTCQVTLILTAFNIQPLKKIADLEMDEVISNISINIFSQINLISSLVKMTKEKQLNIVNINSGAAYSALKGWSLYSGAKAYINMFLKTLVREENVRVVSYDPGVVDTAMQKVIRETDERVFDQVNQFRNYFAEKKLNLPKQVAKDIFERYISNWKANSFEEKFNIK